MRASFFVPLLVGASVLAACASAPPGAGPVAETPALRPRMDEADSSTYGLYLAGEAALGEGEGETAAAYLQRASRSDPGDAALRERAFTASLLAGRVDDAAALTPPAAAAVAPAAAPASGSADGAAALGRLVTGVDDLAAGRPRPALQALSGGALQLGPHQQVGALLVPWAAAAAGVPAPAIAPVFKPGDLAGEGALALNRARLAERAGRTADAEAAFRALGAHAPDAVAALAYGGFLERRDRRPEAVALYTAALAKAPGDAALTFARDRAAARRPAPPQPTPAEGAAEALLPPAASLVANHQVELGVIYLRLALRLNPRLAPAWLLVGDALSAAGDGRGAADAWRKVGTDQPEYADAAGRLAVRLQTDGDAPGALALAADAARRAPDDTAVQVVYAELLRENGRYDEALPVADRLIAGLPADGGGDRGARLYYLRASLQERAGRWPLAETDLRRSLQLRPDDPEVQNFLGFGWADRGEHLPEALALLQKAAAAQPDDGAIADSVGWARYRSGDVKGAVRDLERAVGLAPADPDVNDHLGDAYARVGRRTEADYQWRRVLTLDPDAKLRAAVEAKLRGGPAPPAAAVSAASGRIAAAS